MTKQTDKWQLVMSWGELFPDPEENKSGEVAVEINPDNGTVDSSTLVTAVFGLANSANDKMIDIYAPKNSCVDAQLFKERVETIYNATIDLINKVSDNDCIIDFTETWSMETECGDSVLTLEVVAAEGFAGRHIYRVDFTDEEMVIIEAAATKLGKTPEEFIREAVSEGIDVLTSY